MAIPRINMAISATHSALPSGPVAPPDNHPGALVDTLAVKKWPGAAA
jgi:hypothetical protein